MTPPLAAVYFFRIGRFGHVQEWAIPLWRFSDFGGDPIKRSTEWLWVAVPFLSGRAQTAIIVANFVLLHFVRHDVTLWDDYGGLTREWGWEEERVVFGKGPPKHPQQKQALPKSGAYPQKNCLPTTDTHSHSNTRKHVQRISKGKKGRLHRDLSFPHTLLKPHLTCHSLQQQPAYSDSTQYLNPHPLNPHPLLTICSSKQRPSRPSSSPPSPPPT